ncbi:hypothetical protein GF327_04470 [Candidatus Woesearchaeota archaeon]|nr:hypothetical protein [Candidatus Woesearchaeota archaeon]
MIMALKKGDFIEIEYTGKTDDEEVFDTTDKKTAEENEIFDERIHYGPIIVCLGENHLLEGLEKFIIGKKTGEYKVNLKPEEAFGKKSAKLLRLLPRKIFRKEEIDPYPGLEVNIDGMAGIVRNVSGGRVIVDFNHPLASKNLYYDIKINKKIQDTKQKIESIFRLELNLSEVEIDIKGDKAIIYLEIPAEIKEKVRERLSETIKEIKEVEFKSPEDKTQKKEEGIKKEKKEKDKNKPKKKKETKKTKGKKKTKTGSKKSK